MRTYLFLVNVILISLQPITEALVYEDIYGGDDAFVDQFPYIAYVKVDDKKFCTGVIINEKYVLTAAQCVAKTGEITANNVRIIAGTNNWKSPQETAVYRDVKQIFIRYDYSSKTHEHDLALLLLSEALDCSETSSIKKVDLVVTDRAMENATFTVVGFGQGKDEFNPDASGACSSSTNNGSGKLSSMVTNLLESDECQEHYKKKVFGGFMKKTPKITMHMLCAQTDQHIFMTQPSVCQGDSGAPLIVTNTVIGLTALAGILSLTEESSKCDGSNTPSIYTKVSSYVEFFEKIIASKSYNPKELISKKLENKYDVWIKSGIWADTML